MLTNPIFMNLRILLAPALLLLFACGENNQSAALPANAVTASFQVWGNCGMCEKTIEKGAKGAGAITADWNQDNDQITVAFDPAQTNVEAIHAGIAAVGYDTDQQFGDDAAYKDLPECCQYDRRERGQ
jgi:mercuric ion binding protein